MSDILIRNIEMPPKGQMLVIFPDGTIYVCFNGMREHLAQTKAVPVPPHGDLIDRDALKTKHHWTDDYYETEYVEVEDIDAAPVIISASE